MNKKNLKIGDKVNVKVNDELAFTGELFGISSNTPIINFWIVGIEKRLTKFMQNRPEKAIVVIDSYIEKIWGENYNT